MEYNGIHMPAFLRITLPSGDHRLNSIDRGVLRNFRERITNGKNDQGVTKQSKICRK
jgi:hypothetical protein